MIIHISGPSGSGKTTLGVLLKKKLGNRVIVKDLDELFHEFRKVKKYKYVNKFDKREYQEYIDNFIQKQNKTKPLILTGLNVGMYHYKNHYYQTNPTYKFYIDLPIEVVLKRKFFRSIDELFDIPRYKEKIFERLLKDEKSEIKSILLYLKPYFQLSKIRKETEKWNEDHKKMKYDFKNDREIYEEVIKIVNYVK